MATKKAAKKTAKKTPPAPPAEAAKKPAAKAQPAAKPSALPANASEERRQSDLYAQAVQAFQSGNLKRALTQFETVAEGPDSGLRHRANVHIRICRQRIGSDSIELSSPEDYYNYAVKLINDRRLDEAEQHLDKALKKASSAAHVHYAKALIAALRRNGEEAFRSLSRAIELDPKHRLLARRDPDMAGVRDDARIADLLQSDGAGAD
ncbi:MAG: hypothetical protein KDC27_08855 [Acidobacteria bacterium]|nr:hypothetical protein [Acidobacteriota bacterium]